METNDIYELAAFLKNISKNNPSFSGSSTVLMIDSINYYADNRAIDKMGFLVSDFRSVNDIRRFFVQYLTGQERQSAFGQLNRLLMDLNHANDLNQKLYEKLKKAKELLKENGIDFDEVEKPVKFDYFSDKNEANYDKYEKK